MKDISIYRLKRVETGIEALAGAVARLETRERAARAARLVPASAPTAESGDLAAENAGLRADLEDARESITGLEAALAAARALEGEAARRARDRDGTGGEMDDALLAELRRQNAELARDNEALAESNDTLRHALSTAEARLDAALERLKGLLAPAG